MSAVSNSKFLRWCKHNYMCVVNVSCFTAFTTAMLVSGIFLMIKNERFNRYYDCGIALCGLGGIGISLTLYWVTIFCVHSVNKVVYLPKPPKIVVNNPDEQTPLLGRPQSV